MANNRVVLVTGASRGIGFSIAKALASVPGNIVIGTATTSERAFDLETKLKQEGCEQVYGYALNIADSTSVNETIAAITKEHGAPTILVNNAGATGDNLFLRLDEESWENIININLTGAYRVTKACVKGMLKARWGRVVNISSVVGATGNPGQCNYAAAKAGLIGFTKSLAKEIASRNITVNAVAPGFIATDMTKELTQQQHTELMNSIPLDRMGEPEDIANAVNFLASEQASYITGETIHVNGGMYMS